DRLAHIFNQFEQADELISHNYGGTGLGLTISKNLAEDMGGSLQVESEAGKGAKFTFSVNLPVAEPVRSSGSTEVIGALPTATILVADDEPYNRKLIGAMLENFGQNVLFAENGKQAVEIFKSNFDKGNGIGLLLFDIRMPEMNGANALTAIRAIQDDIEAVALTASLRAGEEDQYIAMGFQDALGKPFDPQQLKKILHTYLPNKKSESKNKVQAMDSKQEDKLDLSGLLATGDNAFVKEMLSLFIEQTENGKLELKQAVKAGNFEDASMCAHRMTGPIRHMGLISLADLMRDFEARIKEAAPHKELISSAEGIDLKLAAVIDMAKQYAV
ncbi:MAG: CheY-like chemotaxis protein/HPt (histidine-containing phosphotransfer) domain-containing protein, partial [Limisphaerales bacterium]